MKQGKAWGTTQEIFNNGIVSINHLKIKEGGYCSEHRHAKKANMFFVISGELEIKIWKTGVRQGGMVPASEFRDLTLLTAGEMTTIEPEIFHKFTAITDVECLEIYSTGLSEDIWRRTEGGIA